MSDAKFNSIDPVVISSNGTHTTTWSGCWADPISADIKYMVFGNLVAILIPTMTATASTTASIVNDTLLPTELRPASLQYFIARNVNCAIISIGSVHVNTDGTIRIFRNAASANYTGCGTSGVYATCLSYLLS